MMTIKANQCLDPIGNIVKSAAKLAEHLVPLVNSSQPIEISFAGMRGLSYSYFNVLLGQIVDAGGVDSIGDQVVLYFESDAQRQVYR